MFVTAVVFEGFVICEKSVLKFIGSSNSPLIATNLTKLSYPSD